MIEQAKFDQLAIKTLKINGVSAVNKANSGHPGIVLGAAPIIHTLFTRHLNFDPQNLNWINRDRFVLSAGHGSALLYAQLRLLGLAKKEDLENFRQIDSRTPGHPEYNLLPGIEATTGPLGQGIAMAVGLAVAKSNLAASFKEINHYVYVLCGDGDLQEGVSWEALSFAGYQKLDHLIVLHDSNDVQLDTMVNKVFAEDLEQKFKAIGFNYLLVKENQVDAIDHALKKAKTMTGPVFIEIKTIIGEGSTLSGTPKVHGAPLGQDFENVKKKLNWNLGDFDVPHLVQDYYQKEYLPRQIKNASRFKMSTKLSEFLKINPNFKINLKIAPNLATRISSSKVIGFLNEKLGNWIGGSADLSSSTKAIGPIGDFSPTHRQGRNINFGVREFAMCAIANGISLHSNFRVFVSTFFVFSDYCKPAIRLAALMHLPVIYVMTHDSVFVGEDGPTHQPIEQLAMIRSMPNINLFRPADEKEVIGAYQNALKTSSTPSVIALTRQNIVSLDKTDSLQVGLGAYSVVSNKNSQWTLVASGSELANAYKISKQLNLNCVSMVNMKKAKLFWDRDHAISIEAASTFGWSKWAKHNIGIDGFGKSGPGDQVYQSFGLNFNSLLHKIQKIIGLSSS